jgi:hypothetical protein
MKTINTKYGFLSGFSSTELYPDGSLKECILSRYNTLTTPYGELVPQYENDGVRRRFTKSLSFFADGNLKSIALQNPAEIETSIGTFPAELLTFYESGRIKRLFPLNGKLSGFWNEADEYRLAQEFEFSFPFGGFNQKIIGVQFYETGAVKSITFWPKDWVRIQSPVGTIKVRNGISVYPEGSLKSLEPFQPTLVPTPIGAIEAYDVNAVGINGDINSLAFTSDGQVQGLLTSTAQITVTGEHHKFIHQPGLSPSLFDDEKMETVPLKIEFSAGKIRFPGDSSREYDLQLCNFTIRRAPISQSFCNGCSACISQGLL